MSRTGAAFVVVIGLACACPPPAPPPAPPALTPFTECTDDSLAIAGAECASLTVPLDWRAPDGDTLTLPVARWRAGDPAERIGALAFDFGGPGIPASTRLASRLGLAGLAGENEDVANRFDRVALDRRGTHLECIALDEARALDAVPRAPGNDAEWLDVLTLERQLAAQCAAAPSARVLPFVDVVSAARDLDALRAALGEDALHLVASSEGTRLAATYATLFPERVGRFVLDSPALVVDDAERHVRDQVAGYDAGAARFFEWCALPANDCPFAPSASAGDVADAFDELVGFLDALPVDVNVVRPEGSGVVRVDGGFLTAMLVDATFAPDKVWRGFGIALDDAAGGDVDGLAELAERLANDIDDAAFRAIISLDRAWDTGAAGVAALADELAASGLRTARRPPRQEVGNVVWTEELAVVRAGVDVERVSIDASAAPPMLILTARGDPATPFVWAEEMRAALANDSRMVVFEGDGHTRAPDIACLGRAGVDFLVDGALPDADASCAGGLGD